jgi:hypothetical protein
MVAVVVDDVFREAIVLDKHGHNVRHNMGSLGLPLIHKSENQVRPGDPLASDIPCHSDQADWFCQQFPGLALREQGGAAVQAEWVPVDHRDLGAKSHQGPRIRFWALGRVATAHYYWWQVPPVL